MTIRTKPKLHKGKKEECQACNQQMLGVEEIFNSREFRDMQRKRERDYASDREAYKRTMGYQ